VAVVQFGERHKIDLANYWKGDLMIFLEEGFGRPGRPDHKRELL